MTACKIVMFRKSADRNLSGRFVAEKKLRIPRYFFQSKKGKITLSPVVVRKYWKELPEDVHYYLERLWE